MLTFNALLQAAGIAPASVRLLRHQENRPGSLSPYVLWRDHRDRFDKYQETHAIREAAKLNTPLWASFVGLPDRQTLFVGIYSAELLGLLPADRVHPLSGAMEVAGSCNLYRVAPMPELPSRAANAATIAYRSSKRSARVLATSN